jgi:hypothetical protein
LTMTLTVTTRRGAAYVPSRPTAMKRTVPPAPSVGGPGGPGVTQPSPWSGRAHVSKETTPPP